MSSVDVSLFPTFKETALKMIDELDAIYTNDQFSAGMKASRFERVLKQYDCL